MNSYGSSDATDSDGSVSDTDGGTGATNGGTGDGGGDPTDAGANGGEALPGGVLTPPVVAGPGTSVSVYVPIPSDYFTHVYPPNQGTITPLINGRSSNGPGPDMDSTEPLDAMQLAVQALGGGDAVYLAAWFFEPDTQLTLGPSQGAATWGQLLAAKAAQGVIIRLLINDFDPKAGTLRQWLETRDLSPFNSIILGLPVDLRDNLKYIVSRQPAHIGAFKAWLAGQGWADIYVGSHHQKFMVVRQGDSLTCFCGGLDIESRKTPAAWDDAGFVGWHDLHVKLEGPITRDLELEFVMRWNLDRAASQRLPLAGWAGYERLVPTPLSGSESDPSKTQHDVQMLRTVSEDSLTGPYSNDCHDVATAYQQGIQAATKFIYMENQYFRSSDLADWIVAQGKAQPDLVVIIVVVANAGNDDGANAITQHGDYLQFATFDKIVQALGARVRIYTMTGRAVHGKFILVDDAWMCVGSANANTRSFEMDSELNIQTKAAALVSSFRARLWGHNLGVAAATAAGWPVSSFLTNWDAVATANATLGVEDMAGEGVVPFDYRSAPGKEHSSIPDALADLDLSIEAPMFAGPPGMSESPPSSGEVAATDSDDNDSGNAA
jgi:phosphatidylserine/phosphatidylglycerophosphate/cardiolipin synthase-like enzyme